MICQHIAPSADISDLKSKFTKLDFISPFHFDYVDTHEPKPRTEFKTPAAKAATITAFEMLTNYSPEICFKKLKQMK